MELLTWIVGFACLGHMAADLLSGIEKLSDKPFKCNMCMTYWLSIIPMLIAFGPIAILYAAIAAITSELIYKSIL